MIAVFILLRRMSWQAIIAFPGSCIMLGVGCALSYILSFRFAAIVQVTGIPSLALIYVRFRNAAFLKTYLMPPTETTGYPGSNLVAKASKNDEPQRGEMRRLRETRRSGEER